MSRASGGDWVDLILMIWLSFLNRSHLFHR
uniref:Uncharacterized protein n=1 Tax=Rhizophora mucronata TaxID=61149 RepID=A0A2P2MXE2_RHIMU